MQSKISNAYKQAMLNKDEDSKRVIGTLRAEIKNKEIELSRNRIIEKIEKKHHWYRWTNRFEPVYVLAMRLDMGVH